MVDIHCHLLYGVDDGAKTLDVARQMLSDAAEQGITDMILTPHYRQGMFLYDPKAIEAAYDVIYEEARKRKIRVFPGCEYHVDDEMVRNLKSGRCPTLARGDYVLAEFSHAATPVYLKNRLEGLLAAGYIPVIAHVERIDAIIHDPDILQECKSMGAMIQINANSVLGKDGAKAKKTCARILRDDLADVVASDSHNMGSRKSRMAQCRDLIAKEYGWDLSMKLFTTNPLMILSTSRL